MGIKYILYRMGQWLARYVPRPFAYWIGMRVGDCYFFFNGRSRRSVISNLRTLFTCEGQVFSEHELRVIARETYHNFGKHVVEFFRFHSMENAELKQRITMQGLETLDQLLAQNRGAILVGAHFGNWELGGAALAAHGYQINAVALFSEGQKINALFQRQRMARGVKIIPMGKAAKLCLSALHRNEAVALLADRDFTGNRSTAEFFGKPARLPRGPVRLAQASGAPILPGFMVRNPDDTFRFFFGEPIFVKSKDEAALDEALDTVARQLEWGIRQYPTQWFIFNDFWNIEEDAALGRRLLAESVQTLRESQMAGENRKNSSR